MIITIDFETAFGKHPETGENITLTSMTNEEYIRHPLFKVLGVGVKVNDGDTEWYSGEAVAPALAQIDWEGAACLAHHAHFDGAILNWAYGHRPKFWLDTLSMANAVFPWMSSALGRLAKHYGMEEKGAALNTTRNKWELTEEEDQELGDYCIHDVDLTWDIFRHLKEGFPLDELKLIDLTVRMYTEPEIEVDKAVVLEDYKNELRQKRQFMKASGVTRKELMSNPKFADRLLALGVAPPMKTSPRTGKQTFAFAKSDDAFNQLLEHEDPRVQALVEARFSVKSTIKETRSKRFYKIGTRGAFPVYLRYYGAHSSRWSGGDKANPQNMTRYNPQDPTSGALRRSWVAPKGQVFVVCDLSQIEARLLAYWAQQRDLVQVFRDGGDPYNSMASSIYGRDVDRKNNPDDKIPGMVGKAVTLGCGYSMSWKAFQSLLRTGFLGMPSLMFDLSYADQLGVDVREVLKKPEHRGKNAKTVYEEAVKLRPAYLDMRDHLIHCAITKVIIDRFRKASPNIVKLWSDAGDALKRMLYGDSFFIGEPDIMYVAGGTEIFMPNSMRIQYHSLEKTKDGFKYLSNEKRKEWSYIYGGKVVENVTQGVARVVISEQMLQIAKELRIVSTTHDEIICLAPASQGDYALAFMKEVMTTPPTWAPALPLDAEGGVNECYGLCEK